MNVVVDQQGHMTGSLVPANPWKRVQCCAGTAIRNPYPYLSVPMTGYPRCYPYPCHSLCSTCSGSIVSSSSEFFSISYLGFDLLSMYVCFNRWSHNRGSLLERLFRM